MTTALDITEVLTVLASRVRSPWYTSKEAAAYLRFQDPSKLHRMHADGRLVARGQRGRGQLMWHVDDLDGWLIDSRRTAARRACAKNRDGDLQAPRRPHSHRDDSDRPVHQTDTQTPSDDASGDDTGESTAEVAQLERQRQQRAKIAKAGPAIGNVLRNGLAAAKGGAVDAGDS